MKSLKRLFGRKSTRKSNRRRLPFRISRPIGYASHVERLEDRTLLASNILASLESSVNAPNDSTELVLNVGPGSSPTLGFEVRAAAGSNFNPAAIQILDANTNAVIELSLAENDHQGPNSLTLATLAPGEYTLLVSGQTSATGGFIIDVFLPGDMDGTGTVSEYEQAWAQAALQQQTWGMNHFTTQYYYQYFGVAPGTNFYSEELDSDKDGDIDGADLAVLSNNVGTPPIQLELIGDQDAPEVDAGLEVDSGFSDSDGITNELTIVGTVTDESLITEFKVALDGGSFMSIFGELSGGANGGTFTLTRGWLEANLAGGSLEGGTHTLHFMTEDEHGNVSSAGMFDVNFELDTIAPQNPNMIPVVNEGEDFSEDPGPVILTPLSFYFDSLGGTPLQFEAVHESGDQVVSFEFSTDQLIINSIDDANGVGYYKIIATDLAGNFVESNIFEVNISSVNDAPVAVDDEYTTLNEDGILGVFGAGAVIANDTDVENDMLTVTEVNGSSVDLGNEITIGAGGKLTLESDGSFSFDPDGFYNYLAAGETATETFTYTISDGNGGTDTAEVTIIITGTNDAPVAVDDTAAVDEDVILNGTTVLANDSDVDTSDMLAVTGISDNGGSGTVGSAFTLESGATVTIQADGSYEYNQNGAFDDLPAGQQTTDTFTYTLSDGIASVTADVVITITGVNDAPVAVDDTAAVDEDEILNGTTVLANDSDVDTGDMLSVTGINDNGGSGTVGSAFTLESGATVTIQANGSYVYEQNGAFDDLPAGQPATDSFTYTVGDGIASVTAEVVITITGVNDAPVAVDDTAAVDEDVILNGTTVLANDSDVDTSDMLAVTGISDNGGSGTVGSAFTLESGASVTIQADGSYEYNQNGAFDDLPAGQQTTDTFTYTLSDGIASVTADVVITITGVNDAPVAVDDTAAVDEDEILNGTTVLANDSDVDAGDMLSVTGINDNGGSGTVGSAFTLESGATVTIQANGSYVYEQNGAFDDLPAGQQASDTFTYTVGDGIDSVTAEVVITITGVNDAPVAVDDTAAVDEDVILNGTTVLANDSDVDAGDMLAVTGISDNGGSGTVGSAFTLESGATVTIQANGSYVYEQNGAFDDLPAGQQTTDTFTYTLSDGIASVTADVVITITGVNDAPVAVDDTAAVDEDEILNGTTVLANDSDVDTGDVLAVTGISDNGGSGTVGNAFTLESGATVTIQANGSYVYEQNGAFDDLPAGQPATDSFTYTVGDGIASVTAEVVITITGVNDAPVAVDDTAAVDEDEILNGTTVLANDSDVDAGDMLSVTGINDNGGSGTVGSEFTLESGASVTILADGTYEYNQNGVFDSLPAGQQTTDTFTYTLSDGIASVTADVVITITGVNDAPVAVDDTAAVDEDEILNGTTVLANDSDVDTGDMLSVTGINDNGGSGTVGSEFTLESGASVTIQADGTYEYNQNGVFDSLPAGQQTTDTFTYTLSDGIASVTADVVITITGANDAPVAQPDAFDVNKENPISGSVFDDNGSGVDSDVDDGDTFTVTEVDGESTDVGVEITLTSGALLTLNEDGTFTYDPDGNFDYLTGLATATDSFSYTIEDVNGDVDTETVTLTISANQMPIANLDTASTDEDIAIASIDVLTNDTDPDGEDSNLTVAGLPSMTSTSGAALTLNMDGTISYDPTGIFDSLAVDQTFVDTFTYTLEDERGGFATGMVEVTVTGLNDAPTISGAVESTTDEDDGSVNVDLLTNSNDVDSGDMLTVQNFVQTNIGDANANAGGISRVGSTLTIDSDFYNYLSDGEFELITYSYELSDGNDGVVMQTASIRIDGVNDAPTVSMGVESMPTEDDGAYVLNLLSNASDIDQSDVLSITGLNKISGDDSGIVVNGNELTITPSAYNSLAVGENAVIEYEYTVIDGNGGMIAQTATITIQGINDAPTATVLTINSEMTEDDGAYSIDLLQNVSDVDTSDMLAVDNLVKFSGNNAGISVNGNSLDVDPSVYSYLAVGESEVIEYHYNATDGNTGFVMALVATITITGVNDAPVAVDDTAAVAEDVILNGTSVLLNDTDVDASDMLSLTGISDNGGSGSVNSAFTLESGATVTIQADGTYEYNQNGAFDSLPAGQQATDTFTYTVFDGTASVTAEVVITINGLNDAPVAVDDTASVDEDAQLNGTTVLANDSDVDAGSVLTVTGISDNGGSGTVGNSFTLESGASVTIQANGSYVYNQNGAFDSLADGQPATDTFTYTVSDGTASVTAEVVITINGLNDAPVAVDDTATVNEDALLDGASVLLNDSDIDAGDMLSVTGISDNGGSGTVGNPFTLESGATVTIQADGTYVYSQNGAFDSLAVGQPATDTFTYTVSDGTASVTAEVVITINGLNDAPVAVDDTASVNEDVQLNGTSVLANDSDVDSGAVLAVTGISDAGGSGTVGNSFTLESGATVTIQANGMYVYNQNGVFDSLPVGQQTTDRFTYTVTDGIESMTAEVVITINGQNDAPVNSAAVTSTSTEDDGTVNVDLLANTTDVDTGDTLSVSGLMKTNAGDDGGITMISSTSWSIDTSYYSYLADGVPEVITYSYDIGDGTTSIMQTLTITINGVNDAPVAVDDTASVDEDVLLNGTTVLANDSDIDTGDVLAVTGISDNGGSGSVNSEFTLESGATVTIQADGTYVYNQNGAFDNLAAGQPGTDSFTYTISDGVETSTATVTITINGQNDPVDAVDDDVTTSKDDTLNIDVRLDNGNGPDTDPDTADMLSIFEISDTTLGTVTPTVGNAITLDSGATVTLQADGTLTYDPNGQFSGLLLPSDTAEDTFTYTISDGEGSFDTATVKVVITGSNEDLVQTATLDDIYSDGLTTISINLDDYFNDPDVSDDVVYTLLSSETFAADFWVESVTITGNMLEITFTDYASDQVRLPTDIMLRAESTDGISPVIEPTFSLIADPQETMEIRLIATPTVSGGRDFNYFRAEGGLGAEGGGVFHLTNGDADLGYSIYLADYDLDLNGMQTGDANDNVISVRLVDTTNGNAVVHTFYDSVGADDNPTLQSSNDSIHGTFTGISSSLVDQLYNGELAVQVRYGDTSNPPSIQTINKVSGGNITVSPEVDDVSDLPTQTTEYAEGTSYNVEIWISDQLAQVLAAQSTVNANVTSVLFDLLWNNTTAVTGDFADVSGEASAFRLLTGVGNPNNLTGVIEDFSGITLLPGFADGNYARVGYATFIVDDVTEEADPVDFTIDITPGDDSVVRGLPIDLSQIDIIGTSVSHVAPSEFMIQTDMSNINIEGTITIDGEVITLSAQDMGLDSTTVSGRLDVLLDDVNDPSTIQILDSFIEVNPAGLANPDRTAGNNNPTAEELADFGLAGILSNFNGTGNPANLSIAIRDALVQVLSSTQTLDVDGNFDISEDWQLSNGDLYSMLVVPAFGNFVPSDTVESTAGETMSFFNSGDPVPSGLASWSQAKLIDLTGGLYELLVPVSRMISFTSEAGYPVELRLTGYATARFQVDQETTDDYGDTILTSHGTGLNSATPASETYYGIIGNNNTIADPLLDVDMFQIYLEAGDTVTVDIDAKQFETGLDSIVRIFDAAGNEEAYSDDDLAPDETLIGFASNYDSYVTYTADADGFYYIGVSAYNFSNDPSTYDPTDTAGRPAGVDPSDVGSYDLHITVEDGPAQLNGTQAVVGEASLEEGTAVDLAVVRNQTELDAYGQTTSLPSSDTWIDEWSSFWVEIYVETADAQGITEAIADLNYNTDFFTATAIEFGDAFADNGQAIIDDATGVVTGLSGTAQYDKAGHLKKALLARVKFESLEQDDVSIDFEDKFIGPHALGLSLTNVSVSLKDNAETTLLVGDAPETDLWAIAYDVNDDDTIDFKDLTVLASVYNQSVLDTDSPYVWALDADKSGTVNFKDLSFFATNYGVSKGGDQDVVYPSNFLQRWYGKTTDISGDSSIDEVMDEALGIWQGALGMDEPLDIQLVITDLGGTQLGEAQITAVDEQGRPVAGIVTLDDDAAGLGWYSEISSAAFGGGELEGGVAYTADSGSDAVGHYDLLTVLLHEIGHVAGFTDTYAPFNSHIEVGVGGTLSFVGNGFEATLTGDGLHLDDSVHAGDVMNATLDPGVRKLPSVLDALILQTAHETAAAGDFDIQVGINAPLMGALPVQDSFESAPVQEAPVSILESDVVVTSYESSELSDGIQTPFNLTLNSLGLNTGGAGQSEIDLTVLEGLSEELVSDLRQNGLSIVGSRDVSGLSELDQLETEADLLGLNQELEAGFDDVFSDWAGPIL